MQLLLEVKDITVLKRGGYPDCIYIKFEGEAQFPADPDEAPLLRLEVARGHGVEYVRKNFKMEPHVINT